MQRGLVGSEMCIRDRRRVHGDKKHSFPKSNKKVKELNENFTKECRSICRRRVLQKYINHKAEGEKDYKAVSNPKRKKIYRIQFFSNIVCPNAKLKQLLH
eukprot:TRINITY_DN18763_c0_g1_i1.p3 TRINITY_DN18763_c0_g1~~TRINITY_DN18763_c0_g1_i1.p3  ORF type:complete len:100 (+),score=21.84 TRINITY_DN18763_c0_g1_i1:154-453(+)